MEVATAPVLANRSARYGPFAHGSSSDIVQSFELGNLDKCVIFISCIAWISIQIIGIENIFHPVKPLYEYNHMTSSICPIIIENITWL